MPIPIPVPVPDSDKYYLYENYIAFEDYQMRAYKPSCVAMLVVCGFAALAMLHSVRVKNWASRAFYLVIFALLIVACLA
jgi:hypothetical protein